MSEDKMKRLSQVAKVLNISAVRAAEYLVAKGHVVESNPNFKITSQQ